MSFRQRQQHPLQHYQPCQPLQHRQQHPVRLAHFPHCRRRLLVPSRVSFELQEISTFCTVPWILKGRFDFNPQTEEPVPQFFWDSLSFCFFLAAFGIPILFLASALGFPCLLASFQLLLGFPILLLLSSCLWDFLSSYFFLVALGIPWAYTRWYVWLMLL